MLLRKEITKVDPATVGLASPDANLSKAMLQDILLLGSEEIKVYLRYSPDSEKIKVTNLSVLERLIQEEQE